MRCKKCNSIIDDNSTFCKYCGENNEVKKQKGFFLFLIIGLLFPLIGIILFLIWRKENKNSYVGLISGIISFISSVLIIIALWSRFINFFYPSYLDSKIYFQTVNDFTTVKYTDILEVDEYVINNEGEFKLVDKIEVDEKGINYSPVYNIEHDMKYTLDCIYYGTYELTSNENVLLLKVEKFEANIEVENEMSNEFIRFLKQNDLYRFNEDEFNLLINEGSFSCEYHQYKYWYASLIFEDMSFYYYPKIEE